MNAYRAAVDGCFLDAWLLNPALRVYGADAGTCVLELDDRQGRSLRMCVTSDVMQLLKRFRDGCPWTSLRNELIVAGVEAERVSSIGAFLAGPCRDKRILIKSGESHVAHDQPAKPAYLGVMIEILPARLVNVVASVLHPLFSLPSLVLGGAVIVAGIVAMFIAMDAMPIEQALDASQALGIGMIALLGIILHELGHAAAAYRLGARRVSVGVGWYLLIRVAYSDLSELWRYPRRSRVGVDLAGVYMQGLVLAFLMLLFHVQHRPVWLVAAGATGASILWNLNPFLRMDGYWVVADAFGIHNLRRRAMEQFSDLVNRWFGGKRAVEVRSSYVLVTYGVLSSAFLGWLLVRAVRFLFDTLLLSLPAAAERVTKASMSDVSFFEIVLGMIVAVWYVLIVIAAARFVAAAPARCVSWWRIGRSAKARSREPNLDHMRRRD